MRLSHVLIGALALAAAALPCQAPAQEVPTQKSSEALVAELAKATDRQSFYPAFSELSRRIDAEGTVGEAAARAVLARQSDIAPGPEVKAILDGLAAHQKTLLAGELLLQIAKAKNTVSVYKKGSVVVGRVVLEDGKLEPELVLAQMEILPEGYFAGEVGDLKRPIGFRAQGYLDLVVPLLGKSGDVVSVGTVTLKTLPPDQTAGVKGKMTLDDSNQSDSMTAHLSMSVPQPNTPHNGFSPRRRWPKLISVPVSDTGEFQLDKLTPGEYLIIASADGHEQLTRKILLRPGKPAEDCAIHLRASDIAFYIGKPAPQIGELAWEKDYSSALKKAQAEKKPMMVMMTATWCGPCKMLESQTLNNPWIRHFLSSFVIVKAYEDKNVEKTYGLQGYPTLVFTDSHGKEACRTLGHQPTLRFAGVCAQALEKLNRPLPEELKELARKKVFTLEQ